MKERPILMSAPMVRAILAGTKTQTRRVVKPQPTHFNPAGVPRRANPDGGASAVIACPYGQPGQRLWVREAWRGYETDDALPPRDIQRSTPVYFEATKSFYLGFDFKTGKLRPGMFMPRWASRITLEVTGVRVERLQSISDADAFAEGIQQCANEGLPSDGTARGTYRALWESINGPGSWDANPWVWCVEFRKEPT
jgi:hypothetical protein